MIIIHKDFPENQYYKQLCKKTQIVLHHTVSSTATSPIDWWKQTPERVAVPFVVDKDGTIYQIYDSIYWAYHIGKGSTTQQNKQSIGIEIVNEGILVQKTIGKDRRFFWLDGKQEYLGKVFENSSLWRGSRFFASYTSSQYEAVRELLIELRKEFNIPRKVITNYEYNKSYFDFNGIVSHHNLRADKSDISIAFDFRKIEETV